MEKKPLHNRLTLTGDSDIVGSRKSLFENQLLNYTQAADYLGITPQYLRELKSARQIPAVEIGRRCVRFRVASLNKFILEREVS